MSRDGSGHFTRIVITLLLCGAAFYGGYRYHHWKVYEASEYLVQVVNVVDGDTLDIDWFRGVARLRIVGIDTFESRRGRKLKEQADEWGVTEDRGMELGRLATEVVQGAVTGKIIRIKFPSGDIERDAFGRLLAYVYVDGVDLGLHLMANGLAYPRPEGHIRDKYYEWPLMQARNFRKGMFAEEGRAKPISGSR
jgi:micrococcal nuclease